MPSWRAADQGSSVPLADGRILWLFNDTITETGEGQGMLRNSVLVTRGSCPDYDSSADRIEFIPNSGEDWWWPTHGVPTADGAWVLAGKFHGGEGAWDFTHVGDALFRVDTTAPAPVIRDAVTVPSQSNVNWSAGIADTGAFLVLFGVDDSQRLRIARTPTTSPGASWEYALGSGRWSGSFEGSMQGPQVAATSLSVTFDGAEWSLLAKPGGLLGEEVVEFRGPSAQGPYIPRTVLTLPGDNHDRWTYNPVRHTWADVPEGQALISISQNVPDIMDVYDDYSLYRPRFVLVPSQPG